MQEQLMQMETFQYREGLKKLVISLSYSCVYGMGEKFNSVNQKGHRVVCQVQEKFCNQGDVSYLVTPFFMTDGGVGMYVKTDRITTFDFRDRQIIVICPEEAEVHLYSGSMKKILSEYISENGGVVLPPDYSFGVWVSANGWNCEEDVRLTLRRLKEKRFPASVLVVEAWSDEATFYIFNGAKYTVKKDGKPLRYEDFDFSESHYWKDPKKLIDELHKEGIRFVLWQIPVYKQMSDQEPVNEQNEADCEDAVKRKLCVFKKDGDVYRIPEGHWFGNSMIPDFTNPETRKSWFSKRQYLLDIGVDGFKTDGGEFILSDSTRYWDGRMGEACENSYAQEYLNAYSNFIGTSHVMFSRAGYTGSVRTPIHWAGDHMSTYDELRNCLIAGLSAAMSGIFYWSFDIGGFAGKLPSMDLYLRSTQFACFCPVMQWHSEPVGGQFKDILSTDNIRNERSPWNIAETYNCPEFEEEIRYWHWLRMSLLPYILDTAVMSRSNQQPMMRPLRYEWQDDLEVIDIEDEYLFGESLLIAPILEENKKTRSLYLPDGEWFGLFTGKHLKGGKRIVSEERFPVYLRSGYGIRIARDTNVKIGAPMDLHHIQYELLMAGEEGKYSRLNSVDNLETVTWENGNVTKNNIGILKYKFLQ